MITNIIAPYSFGFRDNCQYYGSIFLIEFMVYGTSDGPQHDIGNYLGPCGRDTLSPFGKQSCSGARQRP